jgi:hypothetical protein
MTQTQTRTNFTPRLFSFFFLFFLLFSKRHKAIVHDRHSLPLDSMSGTRVVWALLASTSDGSVDDLDTVRHLYARLKDAPGDLEALEWYLVLASQGRIGPIKM